MYLILAAILRDNRCFGVADTVWADVEKAEVAGLVEIDAWLKVEVLAVVGALAVKTG
jgi:hypothetical protein